MPNESNSDCLGVAGGNSYLNECGICVGGDSNRGDDAGKNNCGICYEDEVKEGICMGVDTTSDNQLECESSSYGGGSGEWKTLCYSC